MPLVTQTVNPTQLINFATAAYESAGVPTPDAHLIADILVQADLWGHQSHGVLRLGWYLDRIRNGVMKAVSTPEFVVDASAIAVIDGHDGVGHALAMLPTLEAIKRAKAHGLGAVAVRNSNHFGTCMYYTRRVAAAGCVAMLTSNGGPAMAPWGGRKKIVGTNPFSVAAPVSADSSRAPFVVDMAATGVARGKIYLAKNKNLPIPLGWAINNEGAPTTDPQEAIDSIILPMAEHKGYAIAAMVDMMSGVLSGSGFLSAVHSPYKTAEKSNCGHFVIAMDIAKFQPLEQFHARMQAFTSEIKSVPLTKGFDEVFYPGEMENKSDAKFRREGLQLPDDTVADLRRIAKETELEGKLPL